MVAEHCRRTDHDPSLCRSIAVRSRIRIYSNVVYHLQ